MHFKLICVLVEDDKTEAIVKAARERGATGATVVNNARGEGLKGTKTFFGLNLETQRDMILFLVEQHLGGELRHQGVSLSWGVQALSERGPRRHH